MWRLVAPLPNPPSVVGVKPLAVANWVKVGIDGSYPLVCVQLVGSTAACAARGTTAHSRATTARRHAANAVRSAREDGRAFTALGAVGGKSDVISGTSGGGIRVAARRFL